MTLAALVILVGCGGGSSTAPEVMTPLNGFEKQLVGEFVLTDFQLSQQDDRVYFPEDFGAWNGALELNSDRTGRLIVQMEECSAGPDRTCDRLFTWQADAGLLELECAQGAEGNGVAAWERLSGNALQTRFFGPTNRPDCDQFLIDKGEEVLVWAPVR